MGRIVIACYKPKPGQAQALKELMQVHFSLLKSQRLVTKRDSILMEASDGTIIEVFEWVSKEAIEAAHDNPVIAEMWEQYSRVCDYIPVGDVPEAGQLFSEFTPIDV